MTNGMTVLRHSRCLRKRKDVPGRERNGNFSSLVHLSPLVSFADEEISAGYVIGTATRSNGFPGAQSRLLAHSKIIIGLVYQLQIINKQIIEDCEAALKPPL